MSKFMRRLHHSNELTIIANARSAEAIWWNRSSGQTIASEPMTIRKFRIIDVIDSNHPGRATNCVIVTVPMPFSRSFSRSLFPPILAIPSFHRRRRRRRRLVVTSIRIPAIFYDKTAYILHYLIPV